MYSEFLSHIFPQSPNKKSLGRKNEYKALVWFDFSVVTLVVPLNSSGGTHSINRNVPQ